MVSGRQSNSPLATSTWRLTPHHRSRVFLTACQPTTVLKTPTSNISQNGGSQHPSKRKQWSWPQLGGRGGAAAAHSEGVGRNQGLTESTARRRGPAPALGGGLAPALLAPPSGHALPAPGLAGSSAAVVAASDSGRPDPGRWGPSAAIARWEMVTRPAPAATDEGSKLRAEFVEWMQGLPAGWATAIPGLGRPAQLTALGGVVPHQAAKELELLDPPFPRCARCRAS